MGKGFNNYMTKKFFHPASKDNIKRKWMAEQKESFEKKKQEDLLAQYQKEQEVLSNRALIGDVKAKMGLSFMYDAPPGLKKKEEAPQQEVKFEWQRKYNAPREVYAKDDDTIRDQPFGIEVRNIRCIKCRQWGHVNTDKICPLYGRNLTAEPELPSSSSFSLLDGLKENGFALKNSVLSRMMESQPEEQHKILAQEDEDDPEVKFLKSLTPKQKKKLLKKLNKLQGSSEKGVSKKHKSKKKSKRSHKEETDSEHRNSRKLKMHSLKHDKSPSLSRSDDESGASMPVSSRKDKKAHRRSRSDSCEEDKPRHSGNSRRGRDPAHDDAMLSDGSQSPDEYRERKSEKHRRERSRDREETGRERRYGSTSQDRKEKKHRK